MTRTWMWTSGAGTQITLTYEETQWGLCEGRLTNSTGTHCVEMPTRVQGHTCISLGRNTYQVMPEDIHAEILRENQTVRQRAQSTEALDAYLRDVAPLEAKHHATTDNADSVADEIAARDAYHKALVAWRAQYPDADLPGTIRWHPEINDDNIWSF